MTDEKLPDLPVGTVITYEDEPTPPTTRATIVEATEEEVRRAGTYDSPAGPQFGDVLAEWDDDPTDRSWVHPSEIVVLQAVTL